MILQRDAAATDDGDADLFHDSKVSHEYGEASGKDKRCCPKRGQISVPSERSADSRVRRLPEGRRVGRTKLSALLTTLWARSVQALTQTGLAARVGRPTL